VAALPKGSWSLWKHIYLDLAKQAISVCDRGWRDKKITMVISEGKELEIKQKKGDTLPKRLYKPRWPVAFLRLRHCGYFSSGARSSQAMIVANAAIDFS
jgi:hypothetical protein